MDARSARSRSVLRVALIQFAAGADKAANLAKVRSLIRAAVTGAGAAAVDLVVLPECFNSPYGTQHFAQYAEELVAPQQQQLQQLQQEQESISESGRCLAACAKENNVYIVGGSVPERRRTIYSGSPPVQQQQQQQLCNSSMVFDNNGHLLGIYRKSHLFDIDVPGKITFRESNVLTAGDEHLTFDIGPWRIGVGICFDLRFPDFAQRYALHQGCHLLAFPGAFNTVTGPAHWDLLAKARAVDSQSYVALCSPARDARASYVAYGHSTVADPWGEVLARAGEGEEIVHVELNLDRVQQIRQQLPVLSTVRGRSPALAHAVSLQ